MAVCDRCGKEFINLKRRMIPRCPDCTVWVREHRFTHCSKCYYPFTEITGSGTELTLYCKGCRSKTMPNLLVDIFSI